MAKKMSPVDTALEISRKVNVPKKPVKAKGKKTVPSSIDWGSGIPEDKLAYLNDEEMALVQAHRMFKGKRSFKGIPAFPDPGDTAAGGNSHLPDSGGGAGTRGGGTGGSNTGGGSPSSGGASSSSGGAGGSSSGSKSETKTSAPSSGPTSTGPTSAPARTEPSSGPTISSSGASRSFNQSNPVSTAPSSQSWQGAMDRIAQGSSIIGNPTGQKQITDRVPQAGPSVTNLSQTPSYGPNRGLVSAEPVSTVGANSPFADPTIGQYNRETYQNMSTPAVSSGLLGPSVPVGTAGYTKEQQAARYPGSPAYQAASMPTNVTPAAVSVNPQTGLPFGEKITTRVPGSVAGMPEYTAPVMGDPRVSTPLGSFPAASSVPAGKLYGDRVPGSVAGLPDYAPPSVVGDPRVGTPPGTFPSAVNIQPASAPISRNIQPASAPISSYSGNPFNKSPAERVRDIRQAVSVAMSQAQPPQSPSLPAQDAVSVPGTISTPFGEITQEQFSRLDPADQQRLKDWYQSQNQTSPQRKADATVYGGNVAPSQAGNYPQSVSPSQDDRYSQSPSQQAAYDTSPSQQSGWTDAQRDAYMASIGGDRGGGVFIPPATPSGMGRGKKPEENKTILAPLPPFVNYSYLYTDYPEMAYAPSQNITDFNNYNATFNRGGRIGDSVDSAIRLARHTVVRR